MPSSIKCWHAYFYNGTLYLHQNKIYILLRSNVADGDYGSYYCEVWTYTGQGGAVSMTACIEPADTNASLRLQMSPWKPEPQWLFDRRKEGTTLLVGKDIA